MRPQFPAPDESLAPRTLAQVEEVVRRAQQIPADEHVHLAAARQFAQAAQLGGSKAQGDMRHAGGAVQRARAMACHMRGGGHVLWSHIFTT